MSAVILAAAAGIGTAALSYWLLWRLVRALAAGRHPLTAVAVQAGRFALLALMLTFAVRQGPSSLLAAAAGVFAARTVLVHRMKSLNP